MAGQARTGCRIKRLKGHIHPIIAELVTERVRLNWSRQRLADKIGCDINTLAGWEHGDNLPGALNLFDWCEALGYVFVISKHVPEHKRVMTSNAKP